MVACNFESPAYEEIREAPEGIKPPPPSFADVVVVGGGLAGLSAAWRLRGADVVLLEQGRRIGGNAQFELHNDLRFPTAGSCLQSPVPGGKIAALLRELGIHDRWRSSAEDLLVLFKTGALIRNLGQMSLAFLKQPKSLLDPKLYGLSASLVAAVLTGQPYIAAPKRLGDPIFSELYGYLARLAPGRGRYPSVPWTAAHGWTRSEMEQFDRISLEQLLFDPEVRAALPSDLRPPKRLGGLIRDAIVTTLQVECLTLDGVSGYVGLHFLVGYLYGDLVAFPGGNGFVSERLQQTLETHNGFNCVTAAKVISVQQDVAGEYHVTFRRYDQRHVVNARAVIWAAPKHAAIHAIPDLPSAQRAAMVEIEYGDYIVANVVLKQPIWADRFGAYVIDGDLSNRGDWCRVGGCIVANWLDPDRRHSTGVLTLLKPVASRNDQGRLHDAPFETLRQAVHAEASKILAAAGASPKLICDIRLWRWPKGLVSPRPGQMKSDLFLRASAPWGGVVFANQDSYGVGNFETAVTAGMDAAEHLIAARLVPTAATNKEAAVMA